jgi:hypothetical protein
MALIIAAEDLGIKAGPTLVLGVGWFGVERMAGRANPDQRLARFQMSAKQRHHCLRRRSPANTEYDQIRLLHHLEIGKRIIAHALARVDEGATEPAPFQFFPGEFGQRIPGLIFIFANNERDMRQFGASKVEPFTAKVRW